MRHSTNVSHRHKTLTHFLTQIKSYLTDVHYLGFLCLLLFYQADQQPQGSPVTPYFLVSLADREAPLFPSFLFYREGPGDQQVQADLEVQYDLMRLLEEFFKLALTKIQQSLNEFSSDPDFLFGLSNYFYERSLCEPRN